jgi:predicted ArsR family transcriptional regulator
MDGDFAAQVAGVGALAEPARRALYLYVVQQPEPVSRDRAAADVGLARHTAKFHLDKLVAEGLLSTEFRRLSGRSGPGAGRPTKLYRRADRQIAVTLPERHYDLAGQILAAAIEAAARSGVPVVEAVQEAAAVAGRRIGSACGTPVRSLDDVARVLAGQGYEPRIEGSAVVLVNCPFHALARDHTALVCGMNLTLLGALLDLLGGIDVHARLAPAPQRCCVVVGAGPPSRE